MHVLYIVYHLQQNHGRGKRARHVRALTNCLFLRFIEEVFFAADDFAVFHVDPGDAARDVAHNFVIDGTTNGSNFFDGDEAVALAAEENDFVTGMNIGFAADVDHALVHFRRDWAL